LDISREGKHGNRAYIESKGATSWLEEHSNLEAYLSKSRAL
jgi:hypothetical protein